MCCDDKTAAITPGSMPTGAMTSAAGAMPSGSMVTGAQTGTTTVAMPPGNVQSAATGGMPAGSMASSGSGMPRGDMTTRRPSDVANGAGGSSTVGAYSPS
jgi:hypothetical protein